MADEAPKYRINVTSYIDDRVVLAGVDGPVDKETGEERPVYYIDKESKHKPGPHWEPVNAAAKAMCEKHGIVYTGLVPDCMDQLVEQLEAARVRAKDREQENLGRSIVNALIEAGAIKIPPKQPAKQPAEI
jgi:hypothetical protein